MYKLSFGCFWMFFSIHLFAQSPNATDRISFTITNPGLKSRIIDLRYFNENQSRATGYGYELGALNSHAVNMPVGTRIYEKIKNEWQLKLVVSSTEAGKKIDLSKSYTISNEQGVAASRDELKEQELRLEKLEKIKAQPDLQTFAKNSGLAMVTFRVGGKSVFGKQVFVRAEIPGDEQNFNVGFSRKVSLSHIVEVSYPVGTNLYLCEEPYWRGKRVKEKLFLTISHATKDNLIRI